MRQFSTTPIAAFVGVTLGLLAAPCAHAQTTLNFDDISVTSGSFTSLPSTYDGFTTSNFFVENHIGSTSDGSGYSTGIVSQSNAAFNGGGSPAFFSSATPFTVTSLFLTSAFQDETVTLTGTLGATTVFNTPFNIFLSSPTFITLNSGLVDRFTITTSGQRTQAVLDNVTFNGNATAVTPEGSSLAMFALGGLPLVIGFGRKFRRKTA
jgi:hypothetical protein